MLRAAQRKSADPTGAHWGVARGATNTRVWLMTKWEYVTVPLLVHATKQILDQWGSEGWELVAIVPGMNPQNLVAYLKRPLPDQA